MSHAHDVSGGGQCTDSGRGDCIDCGVALAECSECHGIGYHFNGCVDGDEDIAIRMCACGSPTFEEGGECLACSIITDAAGAVLAQVEDLDPATQIEVLKRAIKAVTS